MYDGVEGIYRLRREVSSCTLRTELNISKMIVVSTAGYERRFSGINSYGACYLKGLSADVVLLPIKLAGLGFLFLNSTLKNTRSCGFEWQKAC
jgi:hypothetical protein